MRLHFGKNTLKLFVGSVAHPERAKNRGLCHNSAGWFNNAEKGSDVFSDPAFYLSQWFASGFPSGAYAATHGLKWVLDNDEVRCPETLREWLLTALNALNERERFIVRERKLRDDPRTLESLGIELKLSKERVRQLEAAAFGKMRKSLEGQSKEVRAFFV